MKLRKSVITYFLLTYGIWWSIALLYTFAPSLMARHFGVLGLRNPIMIPIFYLPSIASFVAYYVYAGTPAVRAMCLKIIPRKQDLHWFILLFAMFLLFIAFLHYGSIMINVSVPRITYTDGYMIEVGVLNFVKELGLIGGVFGWIGFVLPYLQYKIQNQAISALLTGLLFGLWVAPGYFIHSFHTTSSYPLYVLQLMLFIWLHSYIFNATDGRLSFYLFSFWLCATGSHIQLYFFNKPVQELQVAFFALMVFLFFLHNRRYKWSCKLVTIPYFTQCRRAT